MEQQSALKQIRCPFHPSEALQRVDLSFNSPKHLYCFECLVKDDFPKSAVSNLVSIQDLIDKSAISYINGKNKIRPASDVPDEFLEILSNKADVMYKLTKQINDEKAKVETILNVIIKDIARVIENKKNEYFHVLDEQILHLDGRYNFFEKQLKRSYFKDEDAELLFPSKEQLDKSFANIQNAAQLNSFIKSMKEDLNHDKHGLNFHGDAEDNIRAYLGSLAEDLKGYQAINPTYDIKHTEINNCINEVKIRIQNLLKQTFKLENPMDSVPPGQHTYPESSIVSFEHFEQIRKWLPPKFSFVPILLYKASKDEFAPEPFHTKCDGQGPTLTLIKCKFHGSSKTSIIGGFLDKNWHQNNSDIPSDDAFIFSLTTGAKCPIAQTKFASAAHGRAKSGPIFGMGCDIMIARELHKCYVKPSSYTNAGSIVESEGYTGSGSISFTLEEIEVYSLK